MSDDLSPLLGGEKHTPLITPTPDNRRRSTVAPAGLTKRTWVVMVVALCVLLFVLLGSNLVSTRAWNEVSDDCGAIARRMLEGRAKRGEGERQPVFIFKRDHHAFPPSIAQQTVPAKPYGPDDNLCDPANLIPYFPSPDHWSVDPASISGVNITVHGVALGHLFITESDARSVTLSTRFQVHNTIPSDIDISGTIERTNGMFTLLVQASQSPADCVTADIYLDIPAGASKRLGLYVLATNYMDVRIGVNGRPVHLDYADVFTFSGDITVLENLQAESSVDLTNFGGNIHLAKGIQATGSIDCTIGGLGMVGGNLTVAGNMIAQNISLVAGSSANYGGITGQVSVSAHRFSMALYLGDIDLSIGWIRDKPKPSNIDGFFIYGDAKLQFRDAFLGTFMVSGGEAEVSGEDVHLEKGFPLPHFPGYPVVRVGHVGDGLGKQRLEFNGNSGSVYVDFGSGVRRT
ncbi:uncharacterized protein EV422DRAFT_180387 [Fimicolochytrium jonesii]|uniref:uncharacterized protein n=1 Tax=Fimicolochytrium jonesii TaxID=1396493 RepID=UPI0022FF3272|nr:uncharacterized protein EV422DRAFT_180387 [Fimicolochytrium jonesii]KAI8818325.1 hypothetical protein EV422DRAFT_180387 [Fimicolochytrium jonesii]